MNSGQVNTGHILLSLLRIDERLGREVLGAGVTWDVLAPEIERSSSSEGAYEAPCVEGSGTARASIRGSSVVSATGSSPPQAIGEGD